MTVIYISITEAKTIKTYFFLNMYIYLHLVINYYTVNHRSFVTIHTHIQTTVYIFFSCPIAVKYD